MNTILIAEDEKFIRMGLKTMAQRSHIPVGEILEARDGEEALELLLRSGVGEAVGSVRRFASAAERFLPEPDGAGREA